MRVDLARIGAAECVLLVFALCGLVVPAAAAAPTVPAAQIALHADIRAAPSGSTSVPPDNAKKGVSLGPVIWAVPAVAVLAGAVATPLALRRHRERTDRNRASEDG